MTAPDLPLTIGTFARLVGLTPSALRFYDDCGLLPPDAVDASGYRRYCAAQARRAGLLRDARKVGMPLDRVRVVLDGPPDEAAALVRAHVQAVQDGERRPAAQPSVCSPPSATRQTQVRPRSEGPSWPARCSRSAGQRPLRAQQAPAPWPR